MNSLKSSSSYFTSNTFISNWSTTYTQTQAKMKVCAYITCYSSQSQSEGTYSLYRNGVEMVAATFYFNNSQFHMPMPPLIYISSVVLSGPSVWNIYVSNNILVDVNDTCTMTITEF